MQAYGYYVIEGNSDLSENRDLEEDFRELLATPTAFINSEGGITVWKSEDHLILVKLLFLISLNQDYDHPFLHDAPISVDFFDTWWRIVRCEEVIDPQWIRDNIDEELKSRIVQTGNARVDSAIEEIERSSSNPYLYENLRERPRYRIFYGVDVVGWLTDVHWEMQTLEGELEPTKNRAGKEFSASAQDDAVHDVVIVGAPFTSAQMRVSKNRATFTIKKEL